VAKSYDIILGTDVVHATRSIHATVSALANCLVPDGTLILEELTFPHLRPLDVIFGNFSGWWMYDDFRLEYGCALLSRNQWIDTLSDLGFRVGSVVDAIASADPSLTPIHTVFFCTRENQSPFVEPPNPSERNLRDLPKVVVFGDLTNWAESILVPQLKEKGDVHFVRTIDKNSGTYNVSSESAEVHTYNLSVDWLPRFFDEISSCPVIIFAAFLGMHDISESGESIYNERNFQHRIASGPLVLVETIKALTKSPAGVSAKFLVLTWNTQRVTGEEEVSTSLFQSTLWGIKRTIALEIPALDIQICDIHRPEDLNLIPKLFFGAHEFSKDEFAIRESNIFAPELISVDRSLLLSTNSTWSILDRTESKKGSYIITGGLGGFGLAVAKFICDRNSGSTGKKDKAEKSVVILVSRRKVLIPEVGRQLDLMRSKGIYVLHFACDISSRDDLRRLLDFIRDGSPDPSLPEKKFPPLKGVFHTAMVLKEGKFLEHDSEDMWSTVWAPKILGAWNLHEATKDMNLDFFILFSSILSVLGALGQANYASAGTFLDSLTAHRHRLGLPASVFSWGSIGGVGTMETDSEKHKKIAKQGFVDVSIEEANALWDSLVDFGTSVTSQNLQYVVAGMNWKRYLNFFPKSKTCSLLRGVSLETEGKAETKEVYAQEMEKRSRSVIESIRSCKDDRERIEIVRKTVNLAISDTLEIEIESLEPGLLTTDLGIESLSTITIQNQIVQQLGVHVEEADILQGVTLQALVQDVYEKVTKFLDTETPEREKTENAKTFDYSKLYEKLDRGEIEANKYEIFPLNDIQMAYLVGRNSSFGEISTHVYFEFQFSGDLENLEIALNKLIRHEDVLRLVIFPNGQQVLPPGECKFQISRQILKHLSQQEKSEHVMSMREKVSHNIFDTTKFPLFNICATIFENAESEPEIIIYLELDMIILDGRSIVYFFQKWNTLYQNPEMELPSSSISFREYILALQHLRSLPLMEQAKSYWVDRLPTLPFGPELPYTNSVTRADETPIFIHHSYKFSSGVYETLRNSSKERRVTLSVFLLSVLADVIGVFSSNPDFTLIINIFNRRPVHPEIESILGEFTSTILLEVNTRSADTTIGRSLNLQRQLWRDMEHRDFTGVQVIRELMKFYGKQLDDSFPIAFTSGFSMDRSVTDFLGKTLYTVSQTSQLLLDCQVWDAGDELEIMWDAVDGAFAPGFVEGMFEAYVSIINGLGSGENNIWDSDDAYYGALLPSGHREIIKELNCTDDPNIFSDDKREKLLPYAVLTSVQEYPERTAISHASKNLTYREFYLRAKEVQAQIENTGIHPQNSGDYSPRLIGVLMEHGWEQPVSVLGIQLAGFAYLPIMGDLPLERIRWLIRECSLSLVLTQRRVLEQRPELKMVVTGLDHYFVVDELPLAKEEDTTHVARDWIPKLEPRDIAYVLFTSGTTGTPKGVIIQHEAAMNTIIDINRRFEIKFSDSVLGLSALSFDLSVWDIFGVLGAGGKLVIPNPEDIKEPKSHYELISREEVTLWNTVPAFLGMLTEFMESENLSNSNLRLVMMSGDWIPISLTPKIWKLFPNARVNSLGGATEASIWSITFPVTFMNPEWKSIPYGRPLKNQKFFILDDKLRLKPVGVIGRLYIAGLGLALGYWNNPEESKRFFNHPILNERLYDTGDLGRLTNDGRIEYIGREDAQTKINGYRVELREIETVLARHKFVKQCAVLAVGERTNRKLRAFASIDVSTDSVEKDVSNPDALLFKSSEPGLRKDLKPVHVIQLTKRPALSETGDYYRKSIRSFDGVAILTKETFMTRLQGLARPKGTSKNDDPKIFVYVKPKRVEGISGGLYQVSKNSETCSVDLNLLANVIFPRKHHAEPNRTIFDGASFCVYFMASNSVLASPQQSHSIHFLSGILAQQILRPASVHGLHKDPLIRPELEKIGFCTIGHVYTEGYLKFFGDEDLSFVYGILGGVPPRVEVHRNIRAVLMNEIEGDIKDELSEHLPRYMVPSQVTLLFHPLPLNVNGKVDHAALLKLSEPRKLASEVSLDSGSDGYQRPPDETETQILQIWKDVLGSETSFTIEDNFFQMGGDSVLAVRVSAHLRKLGFEGVSVRLIFENPTIRELAQALVAKFGLPVNPEHTIGEPIPEKSEEENLPEDEHEYVIRAPMSPMQQGMVFHSLNEKDSSVYTECISTKISLMHVAPFKRAWQVLVEMFDTMRSSFFWSDAHVDLVQVFHPTVELPWTEFDLRPLLTGEKKDAKFRKEVKKLLSHKWDFQKPPLTFFSIFIFSEEEVRFVWTTHHAILDAWSGNIVLYYLGILVESFINPEATEEERVAVIESSKSEARSDFSKFLISSHEQKKENEAVFWRAYLKNYNGPTPLPLTSGVYFFPKKKEFFQHNTHLAREYLRKRPTSRLLGSSCLPVWNPNSEIWPSNFRFR
jgi:amino acid adenylation domain-containing protein